MALLKGLKPAQASRTSLWQAFPFSPMLSAQLKTLEYMLVSRIAFSSDALGHCCHAMTIHSQKTFWLNSHLHLGAFLSHSNKRQIPFVLFLLPLPLSHSPIKISPCGTALVWVWCALSPRVWAISDIINNWYLILITTLHSKARHQGLFPYLVASFS